MDPMDAAEKIRARISKISETGGASDSLHSTPAHAGMTKVMGYLGFFMNISTYSKFNGIILTEEKKWPSRRSLKFIIGCSMYLILISWTIPAFSNGLGVNPLSVSGILTQMKKNPEYKSGVKIARIY